MNSQLLDYLKGMKQKGYQFGVVEAELVKVGYGQDQINEARNWFDQREINSEAQVKKPKLVVKTVGVVGVMLVLLVIAGVVMVSQINRSSSKNIESMVTQEVVETKVEPEINTQVVKVSQELPNMDVMGLWSKPEELVGLMYENYKQVSTRKVVAEMKSYSDMFSPDQNVPDEFWEDSDLTGYKQSAAFNYDGKFAINGDNVLIAYTGDYQLIYEIPGSGGGLQQKVEGVKNEAGEFFRVLGGSGDYEVPDNWVRADKINDEWDGFMMMSNPALALLYHEPLALPEGKVLVVKNSEFSDQREIDGVSCVRLRFAYKQAFGEDSTKEDDFYDVWIGVEDGLPREIIHTRVFLNWSEVGTFMSLNRTVNRLSGYNQQVEIPVVSESVGYEEYLNLIQGTMQENTEMQGLDQDK